MRPKDRWLTPDEVLALLRVLPPHRQLWVVVAIYTGARDSEVDGLRWEDIDWAQRIIRIRGMKTRTSMREIPLQPVLANVLAGGRNETGYIVGGPAPAGSPTKAYPRTSWQKSWVTARHRWPVASTQSCRTASCATRWQSSPGRVPPLYQPGSF